MSHSRPPQTDSIQELAHSWETHDLTEFEDELDEVRERAFERNTDITVHLQNAEAKALREMARSRGLPESELIREWVLERIQAT